MKYFRQITWNSETLEILLRVPSSYSGTADLVCGASGGQKMAAAEQKKITDLLTSDAQLIFGKDQHILDSIMGALEPVVNAGPNQYGFSAAEDSAKRTQATDTLAAAGRNATNAVRSAVAAQGGMNLPSGSEAAIEGNLAEDQANKQAEAQLKITDEGFATGRQNFFAAEGAAASAPGALENPATSAFGAASGASEGNIKAQDDITAANNAWMAPVAGLAGGVIKGLLPGVTG